VWKVKWALEFRQGYFTPAQAQALAMLYGCVMPPSECARRLDITRQSFLERLTRGERIVDRLWDGERIRNNYKKGRPNARLRALEGAEWMYLKAQETFGRSVAAVFIWGTDPRPDRMSDEEFHELLERERAKDAAEPYPSP
jgi:hypothetical protein